MKTEPQGPIKGIRVADLTSVLLGPWATEILGDMGADVIKVEPPGGESTRNTGDARNKDMAGGYLAFNRNKRSLCIDLRKESGRKVLMTFLKTVDVVVHNMRPSAMERLGLGYDAIREINPKILYCSAYGYAQDGPYADIIQGASGLAWAQTKYTGKPGYLPVLVADKVTALTLVYSVSAGLFHRERTGEGQEIGVPMFETMSYFTMMEHLSGSFFDPPLGKPGWARVLSPYRRPYATKDGFIGVLPYSDKQWKKLFEIGDRKEYLSDPRFENMPARIKNIDVLYGILEEIIASKTTSEWLELLEAADIPATKVNTFEDLMTDPHLVETGFWEEVDHPTEGRLKYPGIPTQFSKTPGNYHRHAAHLGEHSAEILKESGFSEEEVNELVEAEAVKIKK